MANQSVPYDGYPAAGALCTKNIWAGDHFGSNNYQAGGYNLNATQLGLTRIHIAQTASLAQSGNFYARVVYGNISAPAELRATGYGYVTIKWYAANNSEAANNSNLAAEVASTSMLSASTWAAM